MGLHEPTSGFLFGRSLPRGRIRGHHQVLFHFRAVKGWWLDVSIPIYVLIYEQYVQHPAKP